MNAPADYEGSGMRRAAFRKRCRRPSQLYCRIDVTAFLSIQIVLLYLLMIHSSMNIHPHGVTVSRVSAAHSRPVEEANREDALIVAVMRDGNIFFETQQVDAEELVAKITMRIQGRSRPTIFINADARANYRQVMDVLDAVRESKVDRVVFLTF